MTNFYKGMKIKEIGYIFKYMIYERFLMRFVASKNFANKV